MNILNIGTKGALKGSIDGRERPLSPLRGEPILIQIIFKKSFIKAY